jgi:hypothetical protein
MRGISCVAEQLLCGKQRSDNALIDLVTQEYARISLIMEGVIQLTLYRMMELTVIII